MDIEIGQRPFEQEAPPDEKQYLFAWEQSFSNLVKLTELTENLNSSSKPSYVLPGICRFIEKNKSHLDFAFQDEELKLELIPSLSILGSKIVTTEINLDDILIFESLLESNIDQLLLFEPEIDTQKYIALLDYSYGFLSFQNSKRVEEFISAQLESGIFTLADIVQCAPTFIQIRLEKEEGDITRNEVIKQLSIMLNDSPNSEEIKFLIKKYIDASTPETQEIIIKRTFVSILNIEGLDEEKLANAWQHGALGYDSEVQLDYLKHFNRSIANMKHLAQKYGEKSLTRLQHQYGINHFGRYPIEILESMLEHNPELPNILVINPHSDHNASFYNDHVYFSEILALDQKFNFYIIEASGGTDAYLKAKNLRETIPEESLDIVIIGGHGQPQTLDLNKEIGNLDGTITKELLSPAILRLVSKLIDSKTTIVFNACNVGSDLDENSLAKHVFEGTSCKKVIAAMAPITGIKDIKIKKSLTKDTFLEVDLNFSQKGGFNNVQKSVYSR